MCAERGEGQARTRHDQGQERAAAKGREELELDGQEVREAHPRPGVSRCRRCFLVAIIVDVVLGGVDDVAGLHCCCCCCWRYLCFEGVDIFAFNKRSANTVRPGFRAETLAAKRNVSAHRPSGVCREQSGNSCYVGEADTDR